MYFPNPSDVIQAIDAATGDMLWEYRRTLPDDLGEVLPGSGDQPQPRDLRQHDHRHERRRLRLRARRAHGQAALGNARSSTTRTRRAADVGPDHRATARSSPAAAASRRVGPTACVITAHDARPGASSGGARTIAEARRAGRRNLGRHAVRGALARRQLDGAELRPGAEPDFVGTSVTSPAPKFALGGQRKQVPVPQLDARARTPTRARSSGTTSTSSITGISIIRSSGCSSTPPSRRIAAR